MDSTSDLFVVTQEMEALVERIALWDTTCTAHFGTLYSMHTEKAYANVRI